MKARVPLAAAALAACLGLAAENALAVGLDNSAWQQDPNYLRARQMIEDREYASAIPLLEQVLSADRRTPMPTTILVTATGSSAINKKP